MCLMFCVLGCGAALISYVRHRLSLKKRWNEIYKNSDARYNPYPTLQEYLNENEETTGSQILGLLIGIFAFIGLICTLAVYSNSYALDTQIYNYEVENAVLMGELQLMIEDYMGYESQIFFSFSDEVAMTSIPPELKSDDLVLEYMRIYNENRLAILALKNKRASAQVAGWWACFFPIGG